MSSKQLVHDWEIRLTKAQVGHYATAERYMRWHYITGVLLIVFSAFVSSFLFFESDSELIKNVMTGASVVCTILAGVQIFLRPSEQSEVHRSRAIKYGALRRKIELFISVDRNSTDLDIFLEVVKDKWDNIADNSPITPRSLRKEAAKILNADFSENKDLREIKKS